MSDMRIATIDTLVVDGYYRNFVFLKMETKSGLVGWGECSLEGKECAVQGAVQDYAQSLLGRDARTIEEHLRTMTRDSFWMNGPVLRSAMGGLEMAGLIENFLQVIRGSDRPLVTGWDGYRAYELLLASQLSIARGEQIRLPLDPDLADPAVQRWLSEAGWPGGAKEDGDA